MKRGPTVLEEQFPPVLAVLLVNLLQPDKAAQRVTAPGVSVQQTLLTDVSRSKP